MIPLTYSPSPPKFDPPCRWCGYARTSHRGSREFCPDRKEQDTRAALTDKPVGGK